MTIGLLTATGFGAATDASNVVDVFGLHLTGAAAVAAFVVSLCSIVGAVCKAAMSIRELTSPIDVTAHAWNTKTAPAASSGGRPATVILATIYNRKRTSQALVRLQVVEDPGRWKRLVPGWHRGQLPTPANVQRPDPLPTISEKAWASVRLDIIHRGEAHVPLVLIAGFSPKRVKAVVPKQSSAPIR